METFQTEVVEKT